MIKYKISLILLLVTFLGLAQNNNFTPKIWKLTSLSGSIRLTGSYNIATYSFEDNMLGNTENQITLSQMSAGVSLFTKSYVYHPNLLSLDISGGYDPKAMKHQELVQPDYATNSTSKFINVRSQILKKGKFNVSPFFNYNENYVNNENFTSIKSVFKNYGTAVNFTNKYLPILVNYNNLTSNQLEIQSNRRLVREESILNAKTSKDYGDNNSSSLHYSRSNYKSGIEGYSINENTTQNMSFTNILNFKTAKKGYFRTMANYTDFKTNKNKNSRISINNGLALELPKNFKVVSGYLYNLINNGDQREKDHNIQTNLSHQLYESLASNILVEYGHQDHDFFKESKLNYQLNLNYSKKLPFKSNLNVNYSYGKYHIQREGDEFSLQIVNESHVVSDIEIVLLAKPEVDLYSIVVKDVTNTIRYQENIDYILLQSGNFIEIKRVPGGLIENNAFILIDYSSMQPNSYNLNSNSNNLGINMSFYKSTVQIYCNISKKIYDDFVAVDYLTLDDYTRRRYGSKLKIWNLSAGVEYDNYESSTVPFETLSYFVNISGKYKDKLFFSGTYNNINYLSIGLEGREQILTYLNGNISYRISHRSNLNFTIGYRRQQTAQSDLGWLSGRSEFKTRINSLELGINLSMNQRIQQDQKTNFLGGNIIIARKF
ncbi:hypothetical protein [Lutibacter sp.]|uniref:hypothetical protein n=1 Tax=Lutibacter sp. TaxID=1925666 RepID=UPI003564CF16